jgi:hypothetical protein
MLEAHKLCRDTLKANFAEGLIDRHTVAVLTESRFVTSAQESRFVMSAQESRFVTSAQESRFVTSAQESRFVTSAQEKEVRRAGHIQRRAIPTKCESTPGSSQLQ